MPGACVAACVLVSCCPVSAGSLNQLTELERKQGFRLLFDGAMVMTAKGGRDLVTREQFRHFELRLEYTIAERGNSGIMFRVVEDPDQRKPWRLAPEYQLYDSYNVKVRGDRCAGALYGLIAAPKDLAKKPGEWNEVRILLEPAGGGKERLRFWLNGKQTVDVIVDHTPGSRWSKLVAETKSKDHFAQAFLKANRGYILLQDHGARVAFRSIRIRRLAVKAPATKGRKKVRRDRPKRPPPTSLPARSQLGGKTHTVSGSGRSACARP